MKKIEKYILTYPELHLIDINKIYTKEFSEMSEQAYYKAISRLNMKNTILRIAKGIYCIPKTTKYGTISSGENEILNYYVSNNNGVIVGYKLFNKYGMTSQISKTIEIYSNEIFENHKNVGNVKIKRTEINYSDNNKNIIELLEILENYDKIEDLNFKALNVALKNLSLKYDEQSFNTIIKHIKYKKSTLASLKHLLNYHKIENNIERHLRKTSKYKTIDLEKIYELAS